jgi:hypothetical protein
LQHDIDTEEKVCERWSIVVSINPESKTPAKDEKNITKSARWEAVTPARCKPISKGALLFFATKFLINSKLGIKKHQRNEWLATHQLLKR